MNPREKILKLLLENKEEEFSINKMAKKLKLNYRLAFMAAKQLERAGAITVKHLGNSNQCRFSWNLDSLVFNMENIRKEELLQNPNLKLIFKRVMEIKSPFFIFLVFGSYAKKSQTKGSDIDLCLIADDKAVKTEAARIIRMIPYDIHLLDFTAKEFKSMLKTTEFNVGKEILRNNVILNGIESFYRLVNHA